jgi:hypothetical protein
LIVMSAVFPSVAAFGLGLATLAFGVSVSAATADSCLAPKVSVEVPPGENWQTATAELAEHLRSLRDLDKCARVTVRPSGSLVLLEITTGDGRVATREVSDVAELLRTAEALLVLPPQPVAVASKASPLETPPPDPRPASSTPASIHVDLGVGGALRFGGGPSFGGGGVAGFATFAVERWLLTVSGRWDVADAYFAEPTPSDFNMQSTSVGVSAGRRLEVGSANLDALIGPNVVLESQDSDDGNREVHGAAADFRLAVALRVSGPRSSSVRAFATTDFEGSPARIRSQKYLDRALPQLPWWSSGLAVGVLWGAR